MNEYQLGHPLWSELERFQRNLDALVTDLPRSVRSERPNSFPAINVGATEQSFEVVAFLPGIDAKALELTIDKGVLTLSGERKPVPIPADGNTRTYAQERFTGSFRRVIELPQNVDSANVTARYANGCLTISLAKEAPSRPTSIEIH